MIRTFRSKALKRLWAGSPNLVHAAWRDRVENVLAVMDAATTAADLDLPGYDLHALKGDKRGHWAVSVSGNWRITFRIADGHVFDVDLIDYH